MNSWTLVVLIFGINQISFVYSGGPSFGINVRNFVLNADLNQAIVGAQKFLPNCFVSRFGMPMGNIAEACDSGRCLKTKVIFRGQGFHKEDLCCCTNWDVAEIEIRKVKRNLRKSKKNTTILPVPN